MFVIIDRIVNTENEYFVCLCDSIFAESTNIININEMPEEAFCLYEKVYCFDSDKNQSFIDKYKNLIVYDLKTLFELQGHKIHNELEIFEKLSEKKLYDNYNEYYRKFNSILNSYKVSKVQIKKYNYKQLFDIDFIGEAYFHKTLMLASLVEKLNSEVVKYYEETFYKILKNVNQLSKRKIDIDLMSIKDIDDHSAETIRTVTKYDKASVHFNLIGTKTGRLTTKRGTIPVLTMQKKVRKAIKVPENFEIYQFDYKSFQPRIAIYSTDDQDFKDRMSSIQDIYSIFEGNRSENKLLFLRWMFSLEYKNKQFEDKAFAISSLRNKIYKQAVNDGFVKNKFGRVLFFNDEEKNVVFQNYISSNEADIVLNILCEINEFLKNKKSQIMFPFHDALFVKIHDSEKELVNQIINIMECSFENSLFFCKYPVDVKHGKNFGELQ